MGELRSPERVQFALGPEPEVTLEFRDPLSPARGWAVIDSLERGVAFGSVRLHPDVKMGELAQLARITTVRYSLAHVDMSGARLGLAISPTAPDAEAVLGRFLSCLRCWLDTALCLGPDVGVTGELLDRVLAANKLPWRMHAAQQRQGWPLTRWELLQKILDEPIDGVPLRESHVEHSVAVSSLAMGQFLFNSPFTVGVLGSSDFALRVARVLGRRGARVIAVGGREGGLHSEEGLTGELLSRGLRGRLTPSVSYTYVTGDELFRLPCDVLVACAPDDAVVIDNVGRLRAQLVVEAVPGSVSRDAEKVLVGAGASVLPNFAVSMGAVFATEAVLRGGCETPRAVLDHLVERVETTTIEIGRLGSTLRLSLRAAGIRLARHRMNDPGFDSREEGTSEL